jgi:hypothetical protein
VAIAKNRFNPGPLILGRDLRAHLKVWRMPRRTTQWVLAKSLFIASVESVVFGRLTGIMETAIAAGFPAVALVPGRDVGL